MEPMPQGDPRRPAPRAVPVQTIGYLVVIVLLFAYVAFITGRIASASSSTGMLVTLGVSMLAGSLAAAAGAGWGRRDERQPAPPPQNVQRAVDARRESARRSRRVPRVPQARPSGVRSPRTSV
jgi:hypothetical protein